MTTQLAGLLPTSSGSVTTSNNTFTTVCQVDLSTVAGFNANNCGLMIKFQVVGYDRVAGTVGDCALYEYYQCYKRVAGTLTAIGATTQIIAETSASMVGTGLQFSVSGNIVRGQIAGLSGVTIDWGGTLTVTSSPF